MCKGGADGNAHETFRAPFDAGQPRFERRLLLFFFFTKSVTSSCDVLESPFKMEYRLNNVYKIINFYLSF